MQQTLLALAALLTFSIYMFSRHSAQAEVERFAVSAEIEFAATDIATDRLAIVLQRAFDEADLGREGVRTQTNGLSIIGTADPDETDESTYDDVDDYHGVARSIVRDWYGSDLQFTDSVSVRYIDLNAPTTVLGPTATTLAKEVTVTVFAAPVGYIGTPPVGATLRQVATSASQAPYR